MRTAIICVIASLAALFGEEIAFSIPQGIGKDAGSSSQATRTQVEVPKAGKVLDMVFSGAGWSGSMLIWTDFNPKLPGSDAKHWKELVITMKRMGGMDDGLIMICPIVKDAKVDSWIKLEKYDPKGNTQRGFAELVIPTADLGDLPANVIGLHFGLMTKDRDKTARIQVAKISFR